MHMTPEEFRENGYAVIDWLAGYMERVEELRVLPGVAPGDIAAMLPDRAPEGSDGFAAILSDLDEVVMPGITHWQSPNWFAYFPANVSGPSILAELAASGLGQQGMLWSTSPAATEIETRVLDWLVDLMGLPQGWKSAGPGGGVIQMSASDSTHAALVVARHQRREDASAERMVVYASSQAHSSIEKGCTVAGIGHCSKVDVDESFALDPVALEAAIADDVARGLLPVAVVSAVGTTGTTAVDPIGAIADIAEAHRLWHHVDAAYAGTAMICDEFRVYQPALARVDSYTFNPHKWMMVNFDCNVLWVANRKPLIDTMSILPPYLRNAASAGGDVVDYRDWHVPLGRRFRSLKLWWVLRYYGAVGLRAMVRDHVALANRFATWVEMDDRFELFAPHPFGLVCFTHVGGNEATRQLADDLNETGDVAVTPSQIGDTWFIRVSIGQTCTDGRHVEALWELIDELAS
ncbi:MAG: aspartate aminotransferase family protein [Acidimicrobiia bacterium]|nr:MAG: aspartate aminotransferase family protein [Acidimicrobiia bacterium]